MSCNLTTREHAIGAILKAIENLLHPLFLYPDLQNNCITAQLTHKTLLNGLKDFSTPPMCVYLSKVCGLFPCLCCIVQLQ